MYIVAIGWGYVILMMAATAGSVAKALAILILGVLPLALFAYLVDRPRRLHRSTVVSEDIAHKGNATDAESDQH